MKRFLPLIIVAAVALITIALATVLYRSKRPAPATISGDKTATNDKSESMRVRGAVNAPMTLEEFGDFQCPPCGALAGPSLGQLSHRAAAKEAFAFLTLFLTLGYEDHSHE